MKKIIDYSVYLVTDEKCLKGRSLLECLEKAIRGGATLVQYRGKDKSGAAMLTEAQSLKKLCDAYEIPLIINDRLDIAQAVGTAGVHLGQDDLPCRKAREILGDDCIIGVSAHNVAEARQAVLDGADYLGSGAVFGSNTKTDASLLGLERLHEICSSVSVPVVGIGGITADNYVKVLQAGADGAAVVSGILGAEDIEQAARNFHNLFKKHKKEV